jgi:uncharacterized membrane protein YhaH (DUF805 family)
MAHRITFRSYFFPTPDEAAAQRRLYFSPVGRVGRQAWWTVGVLPATAFVLLAARFQLHRRMGPLGFPLVMSGLAWVSIAVGVKRCHDRDRSGWWLLAHCVPVLGTLWSLVDLGFLRGTPGPNRFGPDPASDDRPS